MVRLIVMYPSIAIEECYNKFIFDSALQFDDDEMELFKQFFYNVAYSIRIPYVNEDDINFLNSQSIKYFSRLKSQFPENKMFDLLNIETKHDLIMLKPGSQQIKSFKETLAEIHSLVAFEFWLGLQVPNKYVEYFIAKLISETCEDQLKLKIKDEADNDKSLTTISKNVSSEVYTQFKNIFMMNDKQIDLEQLQKKLMHYVEMKFLHLLISIFRSERGIDWKKWNFDFSLISLSDSNYIYSVTEFIGNDIKCVQKVNWSTDDLMVLERKSERIITTTSSPLLIQEIETTYKNT